MERLPEKITGTKEEIYLELFRQFHSLLAGEKNDVVIFGLTSSLLKMHFESISWVGFYLLRDSELIVGPFQGKPPCIRIQMGKGVCGTAAKQRSTIIVPNVDEFPGHIRCDADSRSEIVVPLLQDERLIGVLDIDSSSLNSFDEIDKKYLERLCNEIAILISNHSE
ncbi:MAG: GAF domain-containing protein [Ignavibacteriales bacterium]|nr:GAF domain-containing protein [Ignavibacteriales bacterium]